MLTGHSAELNQAISLSTTSPSLLSWYGGQALEPALQPPVGGGSCKAPPPLSLLLGILDGHLLLHSGVTVPPTAPGTSL